MQAGFSFQVKMRKIILLYALASLLLYCSHALSSQTRSIERLSDPIILTGKQLSPMEGTSISHLYLYSKVGDKVERIPSQIDERNAKGDRSLTSPKGKPVNPDDGKLDENDELVFMSRDLGGRISRAELPKGAEKVVEITCQDPTSTGKGWAYLVAHPAPVGGETRRYVNYDLKKDYINAANYELGYTPGAMKSYFSTMILKNGAQGRSPNVLDRFKFRTNLSLLFGLINIERTEDDMRSVLIGYKDGPVRAIRRCGNSMYIKFGIRSPTSVIDNYYYGDSIEWPTLIKLSFNVSTIASEASLTSGCDWNTKATGLHYSNSLNTKPVLVDGIMSEAEKNLDKKPYAWSILSGKQGSLISRLWLSKSLVMGKELLYIDDKNILDPPEGCEGHWGYNGWEFDIITVSKGTHEFISYFYFPKDYKPGAEKAYLDILDHPIRMTTNEI